MPAYKIHELFDQHTIRNRVQTIADFINEDFADAEQVVLLCVLKGSVNFFSDLSLMLNIECRYEFVRLTSYEGTESSGSVKLTSTLPDLSGKHIIIVEDIVDTGRTITHLKELIKAENSTAKVTVCTLLDKPSKREVDVEPDYVVFEIADHFVVGYGLDYNEYFRNLPYIGVYEEW